MRGDLDRASASIAKERAGEEGVNAFLCPPHAGTLGTSRCSAVMARLTGNRNDLRDLRRARSTASGARLNRPRSGGGGPGFEEGSAGSGYSGQWIAIQVAVHSTAKRDSKSQIHCQK